MKPSIAQPAPADTEAIAQRVAELIAQRAAAPRFTSFEAALEAYIVRLKAHGKRASTIDRYVVILRTMHDEGLNLMHLNENTVAAWLAGANERLEPSTVTVRLSILRGWAKFMRQSDALADVQAPPVDRTPKPLPPAEKLARFRDLLRPSKHNHSVKANKLRTYGIIYDVLHGAASRIGETLALNDDDVLVREGGGYRVWNVEADRLPTHLRFRGSVAKKHQTGYVPLKPQLARSLANYVRLHRGSTEDAARPLFRIRGKRPVYNTLEIDWREMARDNDLAELGGKTHTGRRVSITDMIRSGMAPHLVIKISRHRDVGSLSPYVALDDSDVERAFARYVGKKSR